MTSHGFPKKMRLLRGDEFDRVFAARASVSNKWLVLYGADSGRRHPRLGLAVSRRQGTAVVRNRWKRLLREAFRAAQDKLPALDLVCVPKASVVPDFAEIELAILELAAQVERKLHGRAMRLPPAGERKGATP
jgi:ribonuclease P protein component